MPGSEAEAEAWPDASEPPPTPEHRRAMIDGVRFLREHGFGVVVRNPGVAETAVIGSADELTGQAVYAFVTLKPYVFILAIVPAS